MNERIACALERLADAQEQLAYWASVQSNIAATGQGFPAVQYLGGDIPDDPPFGATDTSIADALSEQHKYFCGTEVADGEALRECEASHV